MSDLKRLWGKNTLEFTIEYEIYDTPIVWADNSPQVTLNVKYNKKQLRTYKRYAKKFAKLVNKMVDAGFRFKEVDNE